MKPETIKFITKPTFNVDVFVDAHLQGACVHNTISKHSNSSIAENVKQLVQMASQPKIENEVVQFVVDECKMKVPITAHVLKAYILSAMNCPAVQKQIASRGLQTDDDGNTICTSPCPDGFNCGTCASECSVSTLETCTFECGIAIAECSVNIPSCYNTILSCFNSFYGCCSCGAASYFYTCGCC